MWCQDRGMCLRWCICLCFVLHVVHVVQCQVVRGRPGRLNHVVTSDRTTTTMTLTTPTTTSSAVVRLDLLRAIFLPPVGDECASHDDCSDPNTQFCWTNPFGTGNKCVNARLWPCTNDNECDISGEGHCYKHGGINVVGYCGGCSTDTDCVGNNMQTMCYKQHQILLTGQCSECMSADDCPSDMFCDVPVAVISTPTTTSTTTAAPTTTSESIIRDRDMESAVDIEFTLRKKRGVGGSDSVTGMSSYMCVSRGDIGERCEMHRECMEGLVCDGDTRLCTDITNTTTITTT